MIDFTELPEDGTAFEQLIRELLVIADLSPQWTGKGQDQGRDLIAEEEATGPLGRFRRRWLVQCKHNAHSARSVSRDEIGSVIDDCAQASAAGYLLACSTHPSSSTVQKLDEISRDRSGRLVTAVWDSVEIEKRLSEPRGFALAHIFFPQSMLKTPWKIYNMGSPSKWAAHYREYFIYLNSRISTHFPSISEVEEIIRRLEQIQPKGEAELVRPRAIYFDDKHEQFVVFADYLVPRQAEPSLSPRDFDRILQDGSGLRSDNTAEWYMTYWDIKLARTNPWSDRYEVDDSGYYDPYLRNFEVGTFRRSTIGDLVELNVWL